MTPDLALAASRIRLQKTAPYLMSAVYHLIPMWWPGMRAQREGSPAAVTKRGLLLLDPEYVAEITSGDKKDRDAGLDMLAGILLHEALHILRDHAGRRDQISAQPDVWNEAVDAEINDDLIEMKVALPDFVITPDSLGLPEHRTAEAYYYDLINRPRRTRVGGPCAGNCGSGAGNPWPDEPEGSNGRSSVEQAQMRRQVAAEIANHGCGNVPDGLNAWANGILQPARVRWQDRLRRAARSAIEWVAGFDDYTYSRPNRRQHAIGYGDGAVIMPSMRSPIPRVAVAVDTSGSMGQIGIDRAASETMGVIRQTRSKVLLVACDCQVHTVKAVRDVGDLRGAFRGTGGTDFRPVFDRLAKTKFRPNILIFITDGEGPAPAVQPLGLHVIWLLVGAGSERPCDWGDAIVIDD